MTETKGNCFNESQQVNVRELARSEAYLRAFQILKNTKKNHFHRLEERTK